MSCANCPFKRSSPLVGAPDWLKDVVELHARDPFFHHTCHKTDPKADGFVGSKKVKECSGHLQMIFNEIDGTPGKGGVYNSVREMAEAYLDHWQKELEQRRLSNPKSYTSLS